MLDRNLITVPDLDPYDERDRPHRERRARLMGVSDHDIDHG
jgi:hypothetical protein